MKNAAKSLIDFYGIKNPKVKLLNRNLNFVSYWLKTQGLRGFLEGYKALESSAIVS